MGIPVYLHDDAVIVLQPVIVNDQGDVIGRGTGGTVSLKSFVDYIKEQVEQVEEEEPPPGG